MEGEKLKLVDAGKEGGERMKLVVEVVEERKEVDVEVKKKDEMKLEDEVRVKKCEVAGCVGGMQ